MDRIKARMGRMKGERRDGRGRFHGLRDQVSETATAGGGEGGKFLAEIAELWTWVRQVSGLRDQVSETATAGDGEGGKFLAEIAELWTCLYGRENGGGQVSGVRDQRRLRRGR
ncbi:MAG: hypothetical protein ABFE08_12560 [Armatimonadia bacterium]